MEISESNLLVEAAESGNFAAFCVFSLLEGLNLEKISDFQTLYEEIRENLPECEETQDSSWFSLSEFFDFCKNSPESLFEVVSSASRIKMRRAAKRTSRIRARKRAIRERLRKNKTQLAKRAYNQVKSEMRKRLTGGKPWSSLSLTTRSRIDSIISKRKPMLNRMIKQRIQKMPAQESRRLRRLAMRENANYFDKYLMEKQTEQKERESNRERKRRFDQRNEEDPARFINRVRIVKDAKGKTKVVDVDSVKKGYHREVRKLKSPQEAQRLCKLNEEGIPTTPTLEKLIGPGGCPENGKGESNKMTNESDSGAGAGAGAVSMKPAPSYREYEQDIYRPLNNKNSELAPSVAQHIFAEYEIDPEDLDKFMKSYQTAHRVQVLLNQPKKKEDDGKEINPDDLKTYNEVFGVLREAYGENAGKEDSHIKELLSSVDGMSRMMTQYENLQRAIGPDYVFLPAGRKSLPTASVWRGRDKTSKADIIAVPKQYLTGETLKEQIESAKSILKQISEGKRPKEGVMGISVKSGEGRIMSALLSGESSALIEYVMDSLITEDPKFVETEEYKQLTDLLKLIETHKGDEKIRLNTTLAAARTDPSMQPKLQRWGDVRKIIDSALSNIFNKNLEARARLVYAAMTGNGKFESGSPGIAGHYITINPQDNSVNVSEITMDLATEIARTHHIRLGTKSGSTSSDEWKTKFNDWKNANPNFEKKDIAKALVANTILLNKLGIPDEIDISTIQFTDDVLENMSEIQRSMIKANITPQFRTAKSIMEIKRLLNSSFSYNSLLQYLIEANKENKTKELTPEEEQEIDEILDEIQPDLIEYAKTNFNFMLKMLGVEIDSVYIEDPIDLQDYTRKPKTSRANSIYINGELNLVPVDERDDIQEQRIKFALNFLNENKKRNYRGEYDNYHSKPDQRKNRSKRNMARRWAERKGLVRKGDGKDVDHKNGDPRDNSPKNLRVRSRSTNRADND